MCVNFCAHPKTMRNYFLNRCMSKLAYGTTTMLKLLHPNFYKEHEE